MNAREKGKRGERQWRDELRAQGYGARRGQQFSGSPDSPDVVCDQLHWMHFEVKAVEKLNVQDAMDQAVRDARVAPGGHAKVPIVAHKRKFREWLITMTAETFFRFLRGDFTDREMQNLSTTDGTDRHGCVNRETREPREKDFTEGRRVNGVDGEQPLINANGHESIASNRNVSPEVKNLEPSGSDQQQTTATNKPTSKNE